MTYTVDHFLAKFRATTDDMWCVGVFLDESGRCCVMGLCGDRPDKCTPPEAHKLDCLLGYNAFIINDGKDPRYPPSRYPSPRDRIIAALEDVKKAQEKNP